MNEFPVELTGLRSRGPDPRAIDDLLSQSRGVDGRAYLSRETQCWLGGLKPQLPTRFWVHHDAAARQAAGLLGAEGFVRHDRIFLGNHQPEQLEAILRHELVHLAQVQVALRRGRVAPPAAVEREAEVISGLTVALPARYGASPHRIYPIVWFIVIGVGLYVLLRPSVANAPGPGDRIEQSPSTGQIVAEALCFFAIPGGALALGGRIGLGFLGSSALAGAATNLGLRVTGDVARGAASSPSMYLFDLTTGAILGFLVVGGLRLIGQAGTFALDRLATFGLTRSDFAVSAVLAEEAARTPLTALRAQQILASRGLAGQVSKWWFNRRNLILLYRGQETATGRILSPLARQEGGAASEALVAHLRSLGMEYPEIASYTARYHSGPVPGFSAPPGITMPGLGPGAAGIPATSIPAVAARFGATSEEGVIYIIRAPKGSAIKPARVWPGYEAEDEYIFLNEVPAGSIVQMIPANQVPALMIDDATGLLVPLR